MPVSATIIVGLNPRFPVYHGSELLGVVTRSSTRWTCRCYCIQGAALSYVEKHLISGETIQYQTKLHWIVMLGHVAIAAVFELLAIAILVASFSRPKGAKSMPSHGPEHVGALICLLVGAALFCIGLLKRNVTEMAVTNKRVTVKTS